MRLLIIGNSGSGKTTLARRIAADLGVAPVSMDSVAFAEGTQRRSVRESVAALQALWHDRAHGVIEGCYADIAEALLPACDRLLFLNPGVVRCVAHCRQRPWEPDKFASAAEQDAHLDALIAWVRAYPERKDEYGLARHRALFDTFAGDKRELRRPEDYAVIADGIAQENGRRLRGRSACHRLG